MILFPHPNWLRWAIVFAAASAVLPVRAGEPRLESDVLPILTKNCMGCHGGLRKQGGLDLRTIPAMLAGGDSGPAVVEGDAKKSELWTRIVADEMPAGDDREKLSPDEKAVIKSWIDAGLPTVSAIQKHVDPLLSGDQPHAPRDVADAIDQHVGMFLNSAKLKPVGPSDDVEFLRRLYLDLTGRVPTAEQAVEFLDSDDPGKRARLIDSLLETKEFGEQFGRTWRDWVCPPELPSDDNGGAQPHRQADEFGRWLGGKIVAGESWGKIAESILTVQGEIKQQPQVIFFGLAGQGGKTSPDGTARAVASLFMGVQLQCSQCHDDPYRDWSQQEHWGLAAFFSRSQGDFNKIEVGKGPGKGPGKEPGEITIPNSAFKNSGTVVRASFLDGGEFTAHRGDGKDGAKKGDAENSDAENSDAKNSDTKNNASKVDADLRKPFVDWLTAQENPYFAPAFANRLWFYLFSRGIVNPIDDFRELNPPSHPGLMKLLAGEFTASGYDVKHLFRCLCNSAAYQRTSSIERTMSEQDRLALTTAFGRMPLRIMTADRLHDSLKQAYGEPKEFDLRGGSSVNTTGQAATLGSAYLEFHRMFGTNEEDATDFTHGIAQMLTMINHPKLLAGSKAIDERLQQLGKASPDGASPADVVEWLYLSTLSRRPTSHETAEAVAFVNRAAEKPAAYVSVLWMLVNNTEFLLIR